MRRAEAREGGVEVRWEDLLELPLGLALGEVVHVVVLGRHPHQPLRLHVSARPGTNIDNLNIFHKFK